MTPRVFPAADSHPTPVSSPRSASRRPRGSVPAAAFGPRPAASSVASSLRPRLPTRGPAPRCASPPPGPPRLPGSVSAVARRQAAALRAGEGLPTPRPPGPVRTCAPERAPGPGRPSWPPGPRRPRTGPGARRRPRPSTRPPGAPSPRSARRPRGQPGVAPPAPPRRRAPRSSGADGRSGPARRGRSGAVGRAGFARRALPPLAPRLRAAPPRASSSAIAAAGCPARRGACASLAGGARSLWLSAHLPG